MMPIKKFFPFLNWLPVNAKSVKLDLIAGVTVALVLIPQSLAYAYLAGLPAYYGLYAALLPGIIAAMWGTSKQLATGPVIIVSLLTASVLGPLVPGADSGQYIALAIFLALLVGLLQLILGLLKLSSIVDFLSQPVVYGFANAAAIIIALSQLNTLFGVSHEQAEHFVFELMYFLQQLDDAHFLTLTMGGIAFVVIIGMAKYFPQYPGILITVVLATIMSWAIDFEQQGGAVIGAIPVGLPSIKIPDFDLELFATLIGSAIVIALIGFKETQSVAKAMAAKTRDKINPNQDMIAQGLANIIGSFAQSYPVSGSFSRSVINLNAGGRTGLSNIFTAAVVLMSLFFFAHMIHHLPLAVLAAIIILAALNLINFSAFKHAWRAHKHDGIAAGVTFISTLMFAPNLEKGIIIGVTLAIGLYLYRSLKPRVAILEQHTIDANPRDGQIHDMLSDERIIIVRFDASLYFANAAHFENQIINACAHQPAARFILVVGNGINQLDATGEETLAYLIHRLSANGISMVFSGLKRQVVNVLRGTGLYTYIGAQNIFSTEDRALDAIYQQLNTETQDSNIYPLKPSIKTIG